MLSGRVTFELSAFLTSKGILRFTKKSFIQGINALKAQREISIRLVDMMEKLVSLICSISLDYSFLFFKMGRSDFPRFSVCCF